MGDRISRDKETIKNVFSELLAIECPEDGVYFDSGEENINVEDIALDREYNGVEVSVTAHLGSAVVPFTMDIGLGIL